VPNQLEKPKTLLFGAAASIFVGAFSSPRKNGIYREKIEGSFGLCFSGGKAGRNFSGIVSGFSYRKIPQKARSRNIGMKILQSWALLARSEHPWDP